MSYTGFYINLDRRADLRAAMENEFAKYGLQGKYQRFGAADGNSLNMPNPVLKVGELGCFISHHLILKKNLGAAQPLHLVEDDVVFASCTQQALEWVIGQGQLAPYDIVFTDVFVPLLNDAYKAYKKFYDAAVKHDADGHIAGIAFSVINLQQLLFGSTASMLVNPQSIAKLSGLYEEELLKGPVLPIDLFIRKLVQQGIIRAGCIFPFVTSVRLDHIVTTDIARDYHQASALAAHLARYSFFAGADMNMGKDYAEKYLPLPQADRHTQLLNHLLAFSLTDAYKAP